MIALLIGIAGCEQKQAAANFYEKAPVIQQRKAAHGPSDKALLGGAGYNAGFSPAAQSSNNLDKQDAEGKRKHNVHIFKLNLGTFFSNFYYLT